MQAAPLPRLRVRRGMLLARQRNRFLGDLAQHAAIDVIELVDVEATATLASSDDDRKNRGRSCSP